LTTEEIYAHGKLLLTAEYAVLDGALALAVPTVFGQKFTIKKALSLSNSVKWTSYDYQGNIWLQTTYPQLAAQGEEVLLHEILDYINKNNPDFSKYSYEIETHLEFPKNWGLGSSSTLIYFLGKAFGIDAYKLNERFFKGSGYDIACAGEEAPLKFMKQDGEYFVATTDIDWPFKDNVFFAYTGKKKNSRDAIMHYRNEKSSPAFIDEVSALTIAFLNAIDLQQFQQLIEKHEQLLSERLNSEPVKKSLFPDFDGAVKSLGGWGGDFVMLATDWERNKLAAYLQTKNIDTLFTYNEMVFKKQ
jgi:mevalonate kinase